MKKTAYVHCSVEWIETVEIEVDQLEEDQDWALAEFEDNYQPTLAKVQESDIDFFIDWEE